MHPLSKPGKLSRTLSGFILLNCLKFEGIRRNQILHLSKKAPVFGEQTSTVLHRNIQSPSVELHEGNTELKPEQEGKPQLNKQLKRSVGWKRSNVKPFGLTSDRKPGSLFSLMCEFSSCLTSVCQEAGRDGRKDPSPDRWMRSDFCGSKWKFLWNPASFKEFVLGKAFTGLYLQEWTITMSLFVGELCLIVSWISPNEKALGPEPLHKQRKSTFTTICLSINKFPLKKGSKHRKLDMNLRDICFKYI